MDLTTLSSTYQSIKAASEIAKFLSDSEDKIEQAELKLQIADLMGNLVDARTNLAEVKELLIDKDDEITSLKEAFEIKEQLTKENDAYYYVDEEGNPKGAPICLHCWEVEQKAYHLVNSLPRQKICPKCETLYQSRFTRVKE